MLFIKSEDCDNFMNKKRDFGIPNIPLYYSIPLLLICISALLILVALFNFEVPVVLLQVAPTNYVNISSCGSLTQSNTYYVLNQSLIYLNSGYSCLDIRASNVTIDGQGKYWIIGNDVIPNGGQHSAVGFSGNNITISGLNITSFFYGIGGTGTFTSIISNYINDSFTAIKLDPYLYGNYEISNNIVEKSFFGINNRNSVNGSIVNNKFFGLRGPVIFISGLGSGYKNIIKNNLVVNTNTSYDDLKVESLGGDNVVELEDNYFASYNFSEVYVAFLDSESGRIKFLRVLNGSGTNLSSDVNVRYNYAYVNSSKSFLNKSAIITFFSLPVNLTNATVYRDGVLCPSTICSNVTNLTGGAFEFNVTGWSNYNINYTGGISSNRTNSSNSSAPQTQMLIINEPDRDERYTTASFPVTFNVNLNLNGTVKFSLNNGSTNTTMNTTNGLDFTYEQNQLAIGNYTFIAYANFINGTRVQDFVRFRVVNTTGSGGGNNGGGGGGGSSSNSSVSSVNGSSNGTTSGSTTTYSGSTNTQNIPGNSLGSTMRNMTYWLIIAVLSIMIIILLILVFRTIMNRKKDSLNLPSVKSAFLANGLVSNLR